MDLLDKGGSAAESFGPSHFNITNSVNPGRKISHGLVQRLFLRQRSVPRLVKDSLEHETIHSKFEITDDSNQSDPKVIICPYIHPLGKRLEPRIESTPTVPRLAVKSHGRSASYRKEESRYERNLSSLRKADENIPNKLVGPAVKTMGKSMLRDDLALAVAADASNLKEWGNYLKCYCEGRYNMTVPPSPPPRSADFTYLPSTYPPNEIERFATFRSSQIWSGSDIVWSTWKIESARSLIIAATAKFETPWAAISFFDRDNEIIQAERGYSRHLIPRQESIASHVLLTDDVMTVLDTQKDWRFRGNPLVIGDPNIRFFAGVPLISANNHMIGVLAVFGPEPRADFAAMQKRDLIDLSKIATRQLITRRSTYSEARLQDLPGQRPLTCDDRDSKLNDDCTSSSISLRYHKPSHNVMSRSRLLINSGGRGTFANSVAHTPPSSDASDAGTSPILVGLKGMGKNSNKQLLAELPDQLPNDTRTWKSETPDLFIPGAVSVSGINCVTLDSRPPGMNFAGKKDTRESGELFRNCVGFSSDDAADLLTLYPNSPIELVSSLSSFSIDSEEREAVLDEGFLPEVKSNLKFTIGSELVEVTGDTSSTNGKYEDVQHRKSSDIGSSLVSDLTSQRVCRSVDIQAEAKFAAELWAKNLDFDAIYAVELMSKSQPDRQFELLNPEDIEMRIHVSYGLPHSINFDIPIHLDVLCRSGAITWENKNAMPNEYNRGFMMPLKFGNGVLDCHSSGVVFGAFRKRAEKFKSAEIERLQRAAKALKQILSKSPSIRWSDQDEFEQLASLSSQSCHSNEAVKLSKTSSDSRLLSCTLSNKADSQVASGWS